MVENWLSNKFNAIIIVTAAKFLNTSALLVYGILQLCHSLEFG